MEFIFKEVILNPGPGITWRLSKKTHAALARSMKSASLGKCVRSENSCVMDYLNQAPSENPAQNICTIANLSVRKLDKVVLPLERPNFIKAIWLEQIIVLHISKNIYISNLGLCNLGTS